MTSFTINRPVSTREPTIAVDAGLRPGTHRFQLEVIDSSGNRSRPVLANVVVTSRSTTGPGTAPPGRPGTGTQPMPERTRPRDVAAAEPLPKRRKTPKPDAG